ncbi:MAG: peptidylprolyl isomerase [Gammaproteobacteria bacterium]|nr:peptidylprolyl isomerase [Gammaproteobacteria bacterium]
MTVRVVFETALGDVEITVYPSRAPISAGNFLAYVDGGHYDGATLYRAARKSAPGTIGIVQGGLLATAMSGESAYLDRATPPFPPIDHETTQTTGIPNERGTLALARLEPGTASSEFFFNLSDNPELDTGTGTPGRDGFGYATFGRVIRGMEVLDAMLDLPADGETTIDQVRGQILRDPIGIQRAYRAR